MIARSTCCAVHAGPDVSLFGYLQVAQMGRLAVTLLAVVALALLHVSSALRSSSDADGPAFEVVHGGRNLLADCRELLLPPVCDMRP